MEGHWEKEERTEGPESQERCVLLKPQSEESGGKERAGGHALQHTLPVGDTTLRPGGLGPVLPHCCHFKGGWISALLPALFCWSGDAYSPGK